ncbi:MULTISPECIES: hypothetical protein [unclassified Candidatus Cardinium]|uniref:hypothetical protein n=1 Tax=unclassified Candidatus Cardinium TaxID=2641185 RepID=UPI001FB2AC15|nr:MULTISPECIES: hypothetical protein [unclassified Candidatus Cardinium]
MTLKDGIVLYLKAIRDSARDAYIRAKDIESLEMRLQKMIQQDVTFLKIRETTTMALHFLFMQPLLLLLKLAKQPVKHIIQSVIYLKHFKS